MPLGGPRTLLGGPRYVQSGRTAHYERRRAQFQRDRRTDAIDRAIRERENRNKEARQRRGVNMVQAAFRPRSVSETARPSRKPTGFSFWAWLTGSKENVARASSSQQLQNRNQTEPRVPETERVQNEQHLQVPQRRLSDSSIVTNLSDRPPPYDRAVTPPPPYWSLDYD